MTEQLIAAGSALVGALIGALSAIWSAAAAERGRARRARRLDFLDRWPEAITTEPATSAALRSKILMATCVDAALVSDWAGSGDDPIRVVDGLLSVLLSAVNEERLSQGRSALGLDDIRALVMAA